MAIQPINEFTVQHVLRNRSLTLQGIWQCACISERVRMHIIERTSERSALLFVLHFKLRQGKFLLHETYLAAS